MCNAWNHTDGCTCGWGGEGHLGINSHGNNRSSTSFVHVPRNSEWSYNDSYAARTKCTYCGAAIYFIRHNGGSVWIENLGWPWPKHQCYYIEPEPQWLKYLQQNIPKNLQINTNFTSCSGNFSGIAVAGRRILIGSDAYIGLAVLGESNGRRIAVIEGDCTSKYYLGCIVVFNDEKQYIITSNFKCKQLKNIEIKPEHSGYLKIG